MLQSWAITMACVGTWAFLPASTEESGLQIAMGESSNYEMLFTDYSRVRGRWNRNRDGSYDLFEDSKKIATMTECSENSSRLVFLPDEHNETRTFNLSRDNGSFETDAKSIGFFPSHNLAQEDTAQHTWKDRTYARWTVKRVWKGDDIGPVCEASLRDGSFVIRSMRAGLSIGADIKSTMSRLKANSSEFNVSTQLVFDRDVRMTADGGRSGRRVVVMPNQEATALRYLSQANQVAIFIEYSWVGDYNLAGSAQAIAALNDCPID